jgi:hypothetical protein
MRRSSISLLLHLFEVNGTVPFVLKRSIISAAMKFAPRSVRSRAARPAAEGAADGDWSYDCARAVRATACARPVHSLLLFRE